MSPSRFSAGMTSGSPVARQQQRERRVDQLRLVRDVGMALGRRVHLLLQHPLVGRADRVLRPAEDLRARALGLPERELGDRAADPPLDPLGAERDLVVALALAPLLRAVGVADRHADDRDRRVDAAERDDARESAGRCGRSPGRRSPRAGSGSASRRRRASSGVIVAAFSPSPCSRIAARRLVHDLVLRRAPVLEREVEAREARARARSRRARATRSASSSSSCPVSSPSSTTIVRDPSAADDTGRRIG